MSRAIFLGFLALFLTSSCGLTGGGDSAQPEDFTLGLLAGGRGAAIGPGLHADRDRGSRRALVGRANAVGG